MAEVVIVDSVMGSGKTRWAIQYMNEHPEDNILYITTLNKECEERIKEQVKHQVCVPVVKAQDHQKLDDVAELLAAGKDIASTHALFQRYDDRCRTAIRQNEYILFLDETLSAVEEFKLTHKDDIRSLKEHHDIVVEPDGMLTWTGDELDTSYNKIRTVAKNHCLFEVNSTFYVWQFPPDIFKLFKKVYVLTYMFEGSILKTYFDMHDITYQKKSVSTTEKGYELVDYYKPDKSAFRDKIHVSEEVFETVRRKQKNTALSATWFKNASKQTLKELHDSVYNYLHNKCHAKADDILWTTFKDYRHKLKGKGYANAFLSCNTRATNDYNDRNYLVYAVNVYVHPMIEHYFFQRGYVIDENKYALCEMIQWIWRSAIREGEDIYIYIPSRRMRNLLVEWLND